MVTQNYDVVVGIKFLMSAGGHVSHGNVLYAFDVRSGVFPGLTNIEQRENFPAFS